MILSAVVCCTVFLVDLCTFSQQQKKNVVITKWLRLEETLCVFIKSVDKLVSIYLGRMAKEMGRKKENV